VKLTVNGVSDGGAITVTRTDDQNSEPKAMPLIGNGAVSANLNNTTKDSLRGFIYAPGDMLIMYQTEK